MHYHGTPITPARLLHELTGRNFCVSYFEPRQLETCHRIGQSVMLDNGAYSFWKDKRISPAPSWWDSYYEWARPWLDYHTTWAVIPDVIDGTEEENDFLAIRFGRKFGKQGAPVWHMHESLDRLVRLTVGYERVCIGSSGDYSDPRLPKWAYRMDEVFNRLCPTTSRTPVPIHMLRAMRQASDGPWPFASADSTMVAQNHAAKPTRGKLPEPPGQIAHRFDSRQPPARWVPREQLTMDEPEEVA